MPAKFKTRQNCPQCGLKLPRSDTRFCSRECAAKWKAERNTEGRNPCPQCGAPVSSGHRFCSKACSNKWTGAAKMAPRAPCENCGGPVPRKGSRFCSEKCFGEWKLGRNSKNELVNECIPTVDGKNIEISCEVCGKSFLTPHHRLGKVRFCSSRCFGESRKADSFQKHEEQNETNLWRQSLHWRPFSGAWLKAHPKCSSCGGARRGRNLVIHHPIDPNPTRDEALLFAPSNLVVLCRACHVKIHKPRLATPRARSSRRARSLQASIRPATAEAARFGS